MTMEYVRNRYGVPAKRGGRIVYTGDGDRKNGVILSASGGYIWAAIEGLPGRSKMHPTWCIEYLPASPTAKETRP